MPLFRRKSEKQSSNPQNVSSGSRLPRSASNDSGLSSSSSWNGLPTLQRPQTLLLSDPGLLQNSDIPAEALESPIRTTSCLSKTLQEVLRDKDALSCFISFMKVQRADQLIQFWCDAQSFQATTLMRIRTHAHALQSVSKSTLLKRRSASLKVGEDPTRERTISSSSLERGRQPAENGGIGASSQSALSPGDPLSYDNLQRGSFSSIVPNQGHSPILSSPKRALVGQDDVLASKILSQSCDNNPSSPSAQTLHTQSSLLPPSPSSRNATSDMSPGDTSLASQLGSEKAKFSSGSGINQENSEESGQHISALHESSLTRQHDPSTKSQSNSVDITKNILQDGNVTIGESAGVEINDSTHIAEEEEETKSESPISNDTAGIEDVTVKFRKSVERDAVSIFSKYVAKDAPRPIGVDDQLRADTISKICLEDGNVDPDCFQECQEFVVKKMDAEFFQSFKDSEYHCSHQISVLTSGRVFLPDILLAENALCYFMEYMEQEGASDLMQLWLALENFQQQLTHAKVNYDWEQAQNDAMVIYDKYFSLQATHPMGFDDKLRFEIEGNICREGGPLPDCFTKAKVIVLKTLDKIHFRHYLNSQVFHRYLSDLVCTVQMAEDLQNKPLAKGHRRNASDASSEHSFGSQSTGPDQSRARNTLLAVDMRKGGKKGTQIVGDFNMSMDMFNPDDLWKRTSPGGMSLGSVDELGQFVSGFETDIVADKKKGTSFLKRWKDKEKEQEEMALKIAQMIIKDVNTMTRSTDGLTTDLHDGGMDQQNPGS